MDDQFLITQYMIDDNIQSSDEKMKKYYSKLDKQDSKLDNIIEMIKNMMYHNQNSNYPPDNMDSLYGQGHATLVSANKKALPLEGGNSTKKMVICVLSNMRSAYQNSMNSPSIFIWL